MRVLLTLIWSVFLLNACQDNLERDQQNAPAPIEPGSPKEVFTPLSTKDTITSINPIWFSQDLLYSVKAEENVKPYLDTLASISTAFLLKELDTEEKKKAFWLNIYNSLIQIQLSERTEVYKNDLKAFFHMRNFTLCSRLVSLDDIEHRIMRKVTKEDELHEFLEPFMVNNVDFRIHFSMNCGGKSCPAIAFYKPQFIEAQLAEATKVFLSVESTYDASENKVHLNEIFKWYKEDFGGEEGIHKLLSQYQIIPQNSKPVLAYKTFDWSLKAKKFEKG